MAPSPTSRRHASTGWANRKADDDGWLGDLDEWKESSCGAFGGHCLRRSLLCSEAWAWYDYYRRGGYVIPCSLEGVNPVYHPWIFGNPAVAKSYGFVQSRDGTWHAIRIVFAG